MQTHNRNENTDNSAGRKWEMNCYSFVRKQSYSKIICENTFRLYRENKTIILKRNKKPTELSVVKRLHIKTQV